MRAIRVTALLGIVAVAAASAPSALAVPPWRSLLNIRSVEADPGKAYWLTENNGPWLVLAATFAGQDAEQDAHELVIELRRRFGIEAYMHKQHYDYSQQVQGLGVDKYGAPKKMRYLHGGAYDEVAVLAGNFRNV
ncbi:MAG: hypothetical protein KDA41_13890 [Planctomycetales bacterium]|nr:hypothetical protein [Planctomycetales bacterium]